MLRRDNRAHWVSRHDGFLWAKKWYFTTGTFASTKGLGDREYRQLISLQRSDPIPVGRIGGPPPRQYWQFRDAFYWEQEGLAQVEVKALALEQERRKERQLQNALSRMNLGASSPPSRREIIPEDVRLFVWRRDDGKCVHCGSQRNLEFDHIIPVIMGGSSTARNLQLLCESCNRAKGPGLA